MNIKSFFRKQLSTVIEWKQQSPDLLFYRSETPTDEIKNASKLIVAPGQGCILVYEGKVVSVLTEQGTYPIETDNHPFITSLIKIRQMFESEHKMYIYFFRTAELVNQAWGTSAPIKYVDPIYKFPIQMGSYGNFSVKISNAADMFTNIVGSKDKFTTGELKEMIKSRILTDLASFMAESKYSYREIDSHLSEMSSLAKGIINNAFEKLGFQLTDFRIESTTFDDETQERVTRIAGMTAEALSAAEVGLDYVQLEKLRALRDAARNQGGIAGAGLQLGAGLELSKSLMQQKDGIIKESEANDDPTMQLRKLKMLLDEEIITQEEFDSKKKDILNRI